MDSSIAATLFIAFALCCFLFSARANARERDRKEALAEAREKARRRGRGAPRSDYRGDAYFSAMFPELQPWFHPKKVVKLVRDRNDRVDVVDGRRWEYPSESDFGSAQVVMVDEREHIRLFDAAGLLLTEFDYERQPTGGAIRIGRGKLTAVLEDYDNPRVRYWHPEREFKWSRKDGWQFKTPLSEESMVSNGALDFSADMPSGGGNGFSGPAAPVSLEGGTFAGGGASGDWDSAPGATDGGNAGATAY